MNKTNKLLSLFAMFSFLFTFSGCIGQAKDKIIEQMVKETNKQCPMTLDFVTEVKSCEAIKGGIIKYNYVINIDISDIDTVLAKESFYDDVLYNLQNNEIVKPLKIARVSFAYNYKTTSGDRICEFKVEPDDYKRSIDTNRVLSDDEIYRRLVQIANFMGAIKVPLDEITTIKDVKATFPRTIGYTYNLAGVTASQLDTIYFKNEVKNNAIINLKANSKDAILRNNNVIFQHTYFDEADKYICSIEITPEDYK